MGREDRWGIRNVGKGWEKRIGKVKNEEKGDYTW